MKEVLTADIINQKSDKMQEEHKLFQEKLEDIKNMDLYKSLKPQEGFSKANERVLQKLEELKNRLTGGKWIPHPISPPRSPPKVFSPKRAPVSPPKEEIKMPPPILKTPP